MRSIGPLAARIRKEFKPEDFSHRAVLAEALTNLEKNILEITSSSSGGKDYCQVYSSVGVTVPTAVPTAIPFDSTGKENGGMHSNNTQNTRITIFTEGIYDIFANIQWPAFAVAAIPLTLQVRVNGTKIIGSVNKYSQAAPLIEDQQVVASAYLGVGEYIEIVATQTSGGPLVIPVVGSYSPYAFIKEN